jgi:hypothetical protein
MAVRRSGIVGSVLTTALLGTFLYRPAPTSSSSGGPETGQSRAVLATTKEAAEKKSNAQTRSPGKSEESGTFAEEGPWIASQRHFAGLAPPSCVLAPLKHKKQPRAEKPYGPPSTAGDDLRLWCIPEAERTKIKTMIAVIPDPVQTHLALRFDRAIDAIELAGESMHYVLDRYWLPWDLDPKEDWTDYSSFKEAEEDRKKKESEPGLVMFRWDREPDKSKVTLLYVFVVGENSTAGLNGEQFVKALRYVDLLNGDQPNRCKGHPRMSNVSCQRKVTPTYVLGPTSSASLASLAALIEAYEPENFVISTTARNPLAIPPSTRKQFSFFVRPLPEATRELMQMLATDDAIDNGQPQEAGGNQVAVFSEASTSLGASVGSRVKDLSSEGCSDNNKADPPFDTFRYPREIASLRNAYGALGSQNPAAPDKTAGQRPSLSVNLTETTNRSDEPPDFSKAQSPLSQEATLMSYAAELRRKHYRYIGINASNTLDVVFLERYLRSAVPDARLFSFESDLLLEHEPDSASYIGTMSVTTYPLLYPPLNQIAGRSPFRVHTRLPFTSQREVGLYNAAICTIRKMLPDSRGLEFLSERDACPDTPNLGESCRERATPPLWLTVFGNGGHWPIQALGDSPSPDLAGVNLPSSWKGLCTLLCALAVLHTSVLFGVAPFSAKFREFKLGTVAPARQLLGIHTASATLALALALVGISAPRVNLWTIAAITFSAFLLIPCYRLTKKYFLWWKADQDKASEERRLRPSPYGSTIGLQFLVFFGIWLGAAWFAYVWWTLLSDTVGHYGAFFSFRAVHLASIVSPLTPMLPLLASVYIGAIFYVWHLLFNDKIRPRLKPRWETPSEEHHFFAGLRRFLYDEMPPEPNPTLDKSCEQTTLRMRVRQLLSECKNRPRLNPSREKFSEESNLRPGLRSETLIAKAVNGDILNAIIGLIILGLWVLVFRQPQFELFERHSFQSLFETLFSVVMLLILVSGFRLFRIWKKLQKFLQDLNRQRASRVFSHLKLKGWTYLWFYGSEDPDWDYMLRSFEVLQELWNSPELPSCSKAVDAVIGYIRKIRRAQQKEGLRAFHPFEIAETDGELENALKDAQDLLAATLNDVLDRILLIWGNPRSTHEARERQKLLEKYAALRWFSFIRAVVARIRLLILFLVIGFSLALFSLVIYSFEPHQELLWSVTALFITIGAAIITVLIQMHRDPTLSRMVGTNPGKLDLEFYERLITLGVAPVLTLLATHFPSVSRYILSFLQPGLEAMK